MNSSPLSFSLPFLLLLVATAAQPTPPDPSNPTPTVSFRPSVAVVIGVFAIMFTLTFLILMYAKFCHSAASELFSHDPRAGGRPPDDGTLLLMPPGGRFSGIDKSVIDSLPFFRFSSLRGSRDGLECAVCLSRFDGAELLRLLPKCKHAFHVACVDRWLESHSSCPLCRHRIDPHDATLFKYSTSSRFLFRNPSERGQEEERELYVEREPGRGSFRKAGKDTTPKDVKDHQSYHKFKHRIIVSDVVLKSRWSDLNSADLLSLSSDMIGVLSSGRFDDPKGGDEAAQAARGADESAVLRIKEEMEKKRVLESKVSHLMAASASLTPASESRALMSPGNNRSMSEITNVPRFGVARDRSVGGGEEEKVRRLWLPIARRTVQWFAGRERRPEGEERRGVVNIIV